MGYQSFEERLTREQNHRGMLPFIDLVEPVKSETNLVLIGVEDAEESSPDSPRRPARGRRPNPTT